MRLFLQAIGLFFLLISASAWAAVKSSDLTFVIDLDDTLIRYVREGEAGMYPRGQMIVPHEGDIHLPGKAMGYRYRVLAGAPELVQSLIDDFPGCKIVFFSGGTRYRNLQVLRDIPLPNGKSMLEVASKLLSAEDFGSDKQKKLHLAAGDRDLHLENTILIDDNPHYAFAEQERNFLWVGMKPTVGQPATYSKNRLVRARGLVDRAFQIAKNSDKSFVEALRSIVWEPEGSDMRIREATFADLSLYRDGEERFQAVNPQFHMDRMSDREMETYCVVNSIGRIGGIN